jgi:hypothetical protein
MRISTMEGLHGSYYTNYCPSYDGREETNRERKRAKAAGLSMAEFFRRAVDSFRLTNSLL